MIYDPAIKHGEVDIAVSNMRVVLIGTYFAFTSLSTVGFGDFHPRSDAERLMTAAILLAGVATFGFILGNFIDILNEFPKIAVSVVPVMFEGESGVGKEVFSSAIQALSLRKEKPYVKIKKNH